MTVRASWAHCIKKLFMNNRHPSFLRVRRSLLLDCATSTLLCRKCRYTALLTKEKEGNMPKHILGIVCDPPVEGRSLWQDQISSLLATTHSDAFAAAGWTFVEVFTGSVLPSLGDTNEAFDAVIISGSIFNITDIDTTEWMQSTLQWVREFVAKYPTTPIVGICFGHQLLCTLFGGHVATNPLGWEVGTHVLTVAELPRVEDESGENDDNGFSFYGDAGKIIRVQETHSQIVATLPPHGASVVNCFLRAHLFAK
ncbi:glutamine amidotransferase, putative [Bodo saltans]|uniref:Glutamine amidotransferase, putative n=1 Tax=Bodo saltans TaxID=75058 RepID=A0A0S4ISL2_BODSA|nr:glutamine amidotransferase, putative [Bodo saltans]|eukprot:CUE72425.1 glutamine amidotransferase, putative [Bodo saltans]